MARAARLMSLNVVSVVLEPDDEHGNPSGCRHQFTQELQPFCGQLGIEKIDAGQVAARPGEAGDKAKLTGSSATMKTIGIVVVAAFAARPPTPRQRNDHGDLPANQIGRQSGQSII